jgi:hypothetical protein
MRFLSYVPKVRQKCCPLDYGFRTKETSFWHLPDGNHNYNSYVILILHRLDFERPVSASSNSIFTGLPSRLRPFGLWSMTTFWVQSYIGTTVTSSPEEMLQNRPVQRLKGSNLTTGLPSGRLVTHPRELSIIFGDFVPGCFPQCVIIRPNTTVEIQCISLFITHY